MTKRSSKYRLRCERTDFSRPKDIEIRRKGGKDRRGIERERESDERAFALALGVASEVGQGGRAQIDNMATRNG